MNKLILSLLMLLFLTTCGVKGNLYLPQEKEIDSKNSK
jgi:predicted small lipoprotein YifL